MRESAGGIVSYSLNRAATDACFALSGQLYLVDVTNNGVREVSTRGSVIDPRMSPDGSYVAFSSEGSLHVVTVATGEERVVARSTKPGVAYGLADFVAAEELDRSRGHWWSPASDQILTERFDEAEVSQWFISNPTNPSAQPQTHRYPAAGGVNAAVDLWLFPVENAANTGGVRVLWDFEAWEYVSHVSWTRRGLPLIQLLDRRQRAAGVFTIDPVTGATEEIYRQTDSAWVDIKGGVPSWGPSGELLTIEPVDDRFALCAGGAAVTPEGMNVDAVVSVGEDDVVLQASETPLEQHVYLWSARGTRRLTDRPGVHAGHRSGATTLMVSADLASPNAEARVTSGEGTYLVQSVATQPNVRPNVTILPTHDDDVRVAVVLPNRELVPGERLPVLMDPYGGPHAQRVIHAEGAYRESQWFADQGFAVVIVDGRGTPGTPSWERGISKDIAATVLADQVTGLHSAASTFPYLDLERVGIRGWSFGGYLAALAVLDRPDVFHVGVAGAPVTDWRLYDTGYTERYLGTPGQNPEAYEAASLLPRAVKLRRPLLFVHGFADDNVAIANTLQLSQELLHHGKSHSVLPLTGITHMASQEDVAENLMLLQVEFLQQHLKTHTAPS
jgi:dipeptidyl-peptidase-4